MSLPMVNTSESSAQRSKYPSVINKAARERERYGTVQATLEKLVTEHELLEKFFDLFFVATSAKRASGADESVKISLTMPSDSAEPTADMMSVDGTRVQLPAPRQKRQKRASKYTPNTNRFPVSVQKRGSGKSKNAVDVQERKAQKARNNTRANTRKNAEQIERTERVSVLRPILERLLAEHFANALPGTQTSADVYLSQPELSLCFREGRKASEASDVPGWPGEGGDVQTLGVDRGNHSGGEDWSNEQEDLPYAESTVTGPDENAHGVGGMMDITELVGLMSGY